MYIIVNCILRGLQTAKQGWSFQIIEPEVLVGWEKGQSVIM